MLIMKFSFSPGKGTMDWRFRRVCCLPSILVFVTLVDITLIGIGLMANYVQHILLPERYLCAHFTFIKMLISKLCYFLSPKCFLLFVSLYVWACFFKNFLTQPRNLLENNWWYRSKMTIIIPSPFREDLFFHFPNVNGLRA